MATQPLPFTPLARPVGVPNRASTVARIAALRLLESVDYVESLKARVKAGTLAPAIEKMLWHYAYGRPVERIELSVPGVKSFMDMSSEELAARAEEIAARIKERDAVLKAAQLALDDKLVEKRRLELQLEMIAAGQPVIKGRVK